MGNRPSLPSLSGVAQSLGLKRPPLQRQTSIIDPLLTRTAVRDILPPDCFPDGVIDIVCDFLLRRIVFSVGRHQTIKCYDIWSGALSEDGPTAVTATGTTAAAASSTSSKCNANNSGDSGRLVTTFSHPSRKSEYAAGTYDLCVLGDLSMVGTVNRSQRIVLWNYRTFEFVGSFPITSQPIARSSPSGIYSIGGYRSGGAVCCGICYLPKQLSVAVGCNENVVIWHVPTRQITHTLTPAMALEAGQKRSHHDYSGVVLDVALMPDRERLVAMSRDALRVWSLPTLNPPIESLCELAGLPPTHTALKKKKSRSSSTTTPFTATAVAASVSAPNSPIHGSASASAAATTAAAAAALPPSSAAAAASAQRSSFSSAGSSVAAPPLIRSLSAEPAIFPNAATTTLIDTKHSVDDSHKDTKHSVAATATTSTTAATASAASAPTAPPLTSDNAASAAASAKEPELHRACKCLGLMSDSRISFSYGLVVASDSVILSVSFGGRVVAWNVDTRKLLAVYSGGTVACDAVARVSGGAYGSARVVMQQKPLGGWDYDWEDSSLGDEEKRAMSKLVVWEPDPRHPPPPISDDSDDLACPTASTASAAASAAAPEPLKPQTTVLVDSKINPGFPIFRSLTVVDADHLAGSTDGGEWVVLDLNRLKIVARFSGRDHSEQTICSILE